MQKSANIITLITFFDATKAHIVKTKLESENIPCFISDGNLFPTHSFFTNEGGIKLKVNSRDLEKAQKLIQTVKLK